jgi:hypothetical protein
MGGFFNWYPAKIMMKNQANKTGMLGRLRLARRLRGIRCSG